MDFLFEPFQLPFVQRGLVEVLILAVPAGLLGTWIVLRGLAFFSHAVGTAAFPGLVLADGLGFAAPLGAFGAALAFTAGNAVLGRGRDRERDSVVALVLVGCLAAGVILASDVFGSGANVETLLFGSLLLVDGGDIVLAAVAAAATIVATALVGARWLARGFDPDAAGNGWEARLLDAALLGLIALATTAALSVVGALLVSALFVVPAATARLFTRRMRSWQLASIALVAAEGTVGLWLSVKTDAPPGATIACVAGAVFAIVALAQALARLPRAALAAAAATVALALLGGGCGSSGSSDGGQLQVVATTTQIGDWVREVGGGAVAVDQVLQPNTDPHEYEPRPSDVAAAASAKLVFANGDNLDGWIDQIVSDGGGGAVVVDLGAGVPERLPGETSGAEASKYDPHWWHDPRNAEAAVREIERRLAAADPAHRRQFERNARAYLTSLHKLDAGIARCIDSVPAARRKLVTDHDAFGYFARRYGIDVVGAVIPSQTTQAQPSAKDLSELIGLIEREGVEAVFPESSLSAKVADAIASQTGASADHTLYGDTLGPAGSDGATYLDMEAANADSMVRGFSGGRHGCRPSL
ncbi:MAG TPA: zinc ABC transporter substrate-binding protein [Solirubrobacterales bacterium]|jgi:ABC-type Zn uptake system ZnuABC Zn-binding protein ZnuA/ABC-type Mn2+/Zn2+ transport system permease subunit|nr:zinc ABC transporter substrate-binding protein [Solirubrobacterales bacterium]